MMKHSKGFIIFLSTLVFFNLACQHKENSEKKHSFSVEDLKKSLPSPWSLKITPIKSPPYEWKGPIAEGIKIEIFNSDPKTLTKEDKSYKKLYLKSKNSQKM